MIHANARPHKTLPPVATDLTMASRGRAVPPDAHELLIARQELRDCAHQLLRTIGFGQHLSVESVAEAERRAEACGVEDFNTGPMALCPSSEFDAVWSARHHDIGEKEFDCRRLEVGLS
jgi:hypothetical protein